MTNEPLPLDVTDEPAEGGKQPDERLYCPVHFCLFAHDVCPVDSCEAKKRHAKPTNRIPARPQECPHCRAAAIENGEKEPKPVNCEAHAERSHIGVLRLACPTEGCRFSVVVPRADIEARMRMIRRAEESIVYR